MTSKQDTVVLYKSHKNGFVNVDEMDEVHLRNAFKKLIREQLVPEGKVQVMEVNPVNATKALQSLGYAIGHIKEMGTDATEEGEAHWLQIQKYLTDTQILLTQYTKGKS